MKNMTDFRKTLEAGVDPRLETKPELFLGTVERASFSPTDQFRLFVPQR